MTTNDSTSTPPDAPQPELFRTTNLHLTATLGACGHKGCKVFAHFSGSCEYQWPDNEALRRDVQAFDDGTERPGGWPHPKKLFQAVKSLRDVMTVSVAEARQAAEGSSDYEVFQWREKERQRVIDAAKSTPWTRIRQRERALEQERQRADFANYVERTRAAAKPWRSSEER